jgi:cytochrome P450
MTATLSKSEQQALLRDIEDLPGPRGVPILGNLLQLKPASIHQQIEQWAREYGPFFKFRFGRRMLVLAITDHETISAVLRDRPDGFRRTVRTMLVGREMGFDPGVFVAEGQTWADQRRMVMASFAPGHVKAYFPSLLKVTHRLRGRWQKAAREQAVIPLQSDLMRYTVDAIAGLAFGTDINTLESDDDVIQHHLDKVFPAIIKRTFALIPYWRYLRLPADRALDRSVAVIKSEIARFIAQARARMQVNPALREHPGNLLEAMIVAAEKSDSGVNDHDVAGNVLTMLLAGEDTTANTLAWMLYLLQRNPQALARVQEEVRRLAPDSAAFTPEQISQLDYLEACALETMRLKPVAPFLPLEAIRDTAIAGIRVPAGTTVWNVLRHDSVDQRHFPNPTAFDPQRWLDATDPALGASSAKRIAMPFGAGPRVCPGRYLALLEMKMAMAMLLGSFDIQSVDTPDGGEAREHMSFTMTPVGLTMRLRERS